MTYREILNAPEFQQTCTCCGQRFNVLLGHSVRACANYFIAKENAESRAAA